MSTKGYLGIDAGTQGLSAVFTDESLNVLGTGEGHYQMVAELADGCYEQRPEDWQAALAQAIDHLRHQLSQFEVLAIGISGQMHGEVLCDRVGLPLVPARLWCDSRNEAEGLELTERFGVKVPKRLTTARWLWTIRQRPDIAHKTRHLTTPAGWLGFQLTGEWVLGIGDAAGMFPIDQGSLDYNESLLASFGELVAGHDLQPLSLLLPAVCRVGEDAGRLNKEAAVLLGLPAGIPVAPVEGDQPAALAGSLIGDAGMVSISYGTSVCANSVGDRPFAGVSQAVDHFCAPDGKPINMVFLRNGTTFMNSIVEMFGAVVGGDPGTGFERIMPLVLAAAPDCGGVLALPFMDDEPGLGVSRGGTAALVGLDADNATPGNVAKAALLATVFNLRMGSEVLDSQGFPRNELVLSGGLTKTPGLAQIIADVFRTNVTLLDSAAEGTAWGAALLAKYRHQTICGTANDWSSYLKAHQSGSPTRFEPGATAADDYDLVYRRYQKLVAARTALERAV